MTARMHREQARQRLDDIYASLRDRLIPVDESVPLQGAIFREWEDQAELIERELCTAFLEERTGLEALSQGSDRGRCPECGSDRIYVIPKVSKVEVLTPHGPVVLEKRRCRCRSCGRSFSPSGA
jgi:hypothetical protein